MSPANQFHINYAKYYGIHSLAAAAVFAVLYVPLFGWFILRSSKIPTYVHFIMAFFCSIRVSAFVIRAVLARSESAGENLGLLIADQVLFGVGYFGLLASAYTLVLNRAAMSEHTAPTGPLLRLTRNRPAFRVAMMAAVALGVAASAMTNATQNATNNSKIKALHDASVVIFLALTALQAFQTLHLARQERSGDNEYREKGNKKIGDKHAIHILLVISLLLLIREIFTTATMNKPSKANNEHLWYPLYAVPEILAVILYATPGLVPTPSDVQQSV